LRDDPAAHAPHRLPLEREVSGDAPLASTTASATSQITERFAQAPAGQQAVTGILRGDNNDVEIARQGAC